MKKDLLRNISIKKIANLPISKQIQQIDKSHSLVSSDYNSLYPSAMAHKDSKWPKIDTSVTFKKEDSTRLCELFNTG